MRGVREKMPILTREPDCFPHDLLDAADLPVGDADRGWWLVYTRARREKDLSRRLAAVGVPCYCPTVGRRTRSASGRIREAYVPLFPGYVFLLASEEERYVALSTNCVSSACRIPDPDRCVGELRSIRRLLASGVPVTPEARIESGTRVRVVNGPLRGQEGVVIERLGRRRLLVTVQMLRQGASADVDECDVERI